MSRIYNKLALHLDYNYVCDNSVFEEFLEDLKHELGYYDKNNTIPMFDYDEINYVSNDCESNGQWYEITDYNQTIDPDKLAEAFEEWDEIANDVYDDDVDEDEEIQKRQTAFIKKLVNKIQHSNAI